MHYAVNLALINLHQRRCHPVYWLLAPLLTEQVVTPDPGRVDGDAIILNTDDDRWPAVIAILQATEDNGNGLGNYFKLYQSANGHTAWRRIEVRALRPVAS